MPDGLIVFSILIFGFVTLAYSVSLSVAMAVESEGWNTFAMIGSMVLINPFIMLLGQIPEITNNVSTERVVWSLPAVAILLVEIVGGIAVLVVTGWVHCRKKAFY
ncbi:MAG: hypothetical protein QM795_09165 [Pseudoxanthomonas sp.]